jgi:hypothetical protein
MCAQGALKLVCVSSAMTSKSTVPLPASPPFRGSRFPWKGSRGLSGSSTGTSACSYALIVCDRLNGPPRKVFRRVKRRFSYC